MYSGAEVCTETLGTVTDPLLEAIPCECSAQTHLCSGTSHMLVPSHRVSLEQFVNFQFEKLSKLFPRWLSVKESAYQYRKHRRPGLIPGLGKSSAGGHGNPLQCSCLENPMDKGAWRAAVHRVTENQAALSTHTRHAQYSLVLTSIS